MKILMATMGLDIGGAETHIVELSKQLKSEGHDIAIVSNGGVYVPEITVAGIRHYEAPLHRRDVKDMLRARSILRDVIRKEQPDVVHAHARIPAFLCGTLHKKMGFPFVTTAHWVFDSKGMLRYLTDWGQRTVAVSNDIKDYLIREYGIPQEHISITINGIDTEKFSPGISRDNILKEFGLDGTKPIVSYVSRMDEDRALVARQMISIVPELDRAVPGIQLLIAGGGNVFEELKAESQRINREIGRTCVVMTGPRTDINEIAAAGDVFVGVSRSALEAMAAAKPVIVAGNEGYQGLFTPDKLEEARLGNFCCRGCPMSEAERLLADLTEVMGYSAEQKKQLGEYGRQVIFQYYSVRRMAKDCLDMYEQVRKKKYHILMSGYYGFSNAGDDAILESVHQSIRKVSNEIAITVLSNDPEQTRRCYGVNAIHRFHILQVWKALRRCDVLLSGGGSLLQDRTSTRSILYYLSIIRGAALLGKPVMLYANGIGPVDKPRNRKRVKRAVECADLITLRDHSSRQELMEMGVTRQDLHVTADPVFHLEPAGKEESFQLLQRAGLNGHTPFAAVAVRNWPNTDGFFTELASVCDHLRRTYGLEILFLLMQPQNDQQAAQTVREAMEEPSYLLDVSCAPKELMGVLGEAKLCLAMRLHTLIFAARMSVPMLGLVYDPKVESYLKELNMPSAGWVDAFDRNRAIEAADKLMKEYEQYRSSLEERSRQLAGAAEENERLLMELLKKHRG